MKTQEVEIIKSMDEFFGWLHVHYIKLAKELWHADRMQLTIWPDMYHKITHYLWQNYGATPKDEMLRVDGIPVHVSTKHQPGTCILEIKDWWPGVDLYGNANPKPPVFIATIENF